MVQNTGNVAMQMNEMCGTMLNIMFNNADNDIFEDSIQKEVLPIKISALDVEKLNQHLYKACLVHEENERATWREAKNHYASR